MRLGWVLPLLLLFFNCLARGAPQLEPNCGTIDSTTLTAQDTSLFSVTGNALEISCFSTLPVSSIPSNCNATNITVVLQILSTSGSLPLREMDLTQLTKGSVYSIIVEQTEVVQFNIVARFPAWNFCPTTLFHSIYGTYTSQSALIEVPILTSVTPDIVDAGIPATFAFRTVSNVTEARVLILDEGLTCSGNAASTWSASTAIAPVMFSPTSFQWSASVSVAGQYRLCTWTSSTMRWAVVALFQVYGGQPAFFKSVMTSQTNTGETDKFTFVGNGLDATRDKVKLIDDDGTKCSDSASASKTATTYGPFADGQTSLKTYATVDFTYVWGGASYKVCYYVASVGTWSSVPDYDSMTREVTDRYTNQLPDADSGAGSGQITCATAPYDSSNVAVTNSQAVLLLIGGSRLPTALDSTLASYLCILPEEISIVSFTPGSSESRVVFQVHCTTTKCNDAERQSAFTSKYPTIAIPNLERVQLISWNGVDVPGSGSGEGDSTGDDPVHDGTVVLAIGVGLSVLLLVVTAVAVYIVRKRHQAQLVHRSIGRVVEGSIIEAPNPNLTYAEGITGYQEPGYQPPPTAPPPPAASNTGARRRDRRAAVDVDGDTELAVPLTEP